MSLWRFLGRPLQRRIVLATALSLLAAVLDSVGLAAVFLLFKILADPDTRMPYVHLAPLTIAVALLLVFAVKTALALHLLHLRQAIEHGVRQHVGNRLLGQYLAAPADFHRRRSVTDLVHTIHAGATASAMVTTAAIDLVADGALGVTVVVLLLYAQPLATALLTIICGGLALIHSCFVRQRIARWGASANRDAALGHETLIDAIAGLDVVKALGVEAYWLHRYDGQLQSYAAALSRSAFVQQSLKPLAETALAAALLIPVVGYLVVSAPLAALLPILVLYAAAALRLLPSGLRLLATIHTLQFQRSLVTIVVMDLRDDL